jgi:hypothetical protein
MFPGSAPVKLTLQAIEEHLDASTLVIRMSKGQIWTSLRRNGVTKRWKREPSRFRIPVKFGFKECGEITQDTEIVLLSDGRFAI